MNMDKVYIIPPENIGKNFISKEYSPEGGNEYIKRNTQVRKPINGWRGLRADELEMLVKNDNTASNWDDILVTDPFDPNLIQNTRFYGLVRIGRLQNITLQHHDLRLPSGITNSFIISCDIGDDVAIHNVHYLAHYIIGERCILFNIQEMHVTDHAKFGNGIIKEGESEDVRTWLEPMNESGSRKILPFDGIITADAYLWAKYVDDISLQKKLLEITQNSMDKSRGYYGTVDRYSVVKNSLILKDVKIGECCYIKGANKLKNLTINSTSEEPTQIGEGVELVNGIIGYGCHIFYGCKAVKFVLGNNSNLKYGARLINSVLGDNSTISCCEVLNNLIFPGHEQHHNNSFLIASVVMGQSNMAAGATIGSNHNSRSNDNEIQAGRGFWPALCTSVKHSCRFASFVLLSKADYPSEMNIPFPFCLVTNNVSEDQLEIMPAYWWMYNMYALERNTRKYLARDKRVFKVQNIEFDIYAPDTIEEVVNACTLLEIWVAKAAMRKKNEDENDNIILAQQGKKILSGEEIIVNSLEVTGEDIEHSGRKVVIKKVWKAYHAYMDILHYYCVKNLLMYFISSPDEDIGNMNEKLAGRHERKWVNMGGQLMLESDVDILRSDIVTGKLETWDQIHKRYDEIWEKYPLDKQKHAYTLLCEMYKTEKINSSNMGLALDRFVSIIRYIEDQVYVTRKKDYDNKFRHATYRNDEEMYAALGQIEDNTFIKQIKSDTAEFVKVVEAVRDRILK